MDIQENSFDRNRIRAVDIVTAPVSVRFLEGRPEYFAKKGYEVTIVSAAGEELRKAERNGVRTVAVPMAREISPLRDLVSLWGLVRVMLRLRPTITNVATPKAGLGRNSCVVVWRAVPILYVARIAMRDHDGPQTKSTGDERAHRLRVRAPGHLCERKPAAKGDRVGHRRPEPDGGACFWKFCWNGSQAIRVFAGC
jgi:hypothetical protein